MKKLFLSIMLFSSTQLVNPDVLVSGDFFSRSYVLMDGYSGEILEGKDYHLQRSVASISKIMTAILAIESDKMFYSFTIPEEACFIEGSSIYLQPNDQYRLVDLTYGLLLRSGNDAAYAISLCVEKTTSDFVLKMNQKAEEIGMENTLFSNPCGLDINDAGNLSTSYDMALLMRYCLNNPLFQEIISCKEYRYENHLYINKNKLLKSYEYLIGGKTGFTSKARRTLVTAAKKEEQYLIMVTLDSGSDYAFHKALYESYFNKYQYLVFLNKGKNYIDNYVFDSQEVIGMRLEKEKVLKGIKKYFINPYTHQLTISFIDEQGIEYFGGSFNEVNFID